MPKDSLDDFSDEPLTGKENQKTRKIIRDQERMDWLWASARVWAGWAAAASTASFAAKDYIVKIIQAVFS